MFSLRLIRNWVRNELIIRSYGLKNIKKILREWKFLVGACQYRDNCPTQWEQIYNGVQLTVPLKFYKILPMFDSEIPELEISEGHLVKVLSY